MSQDSCVVPERDAMTRIGAENARRWPRRRTLEVSMKYALIPALAISLVSGVSTLPAERRDYSPERDRIQERHDDRAPPRHQWQRGERLPAEFARGHEVIDWRARRLRTPPRGYHWVNVDGDFVLAGVVLDFALPNAYAYPPHPYPGSYAEPAPGAYPYPPYDDGGAPPSGGPYPPPAGASAPNWYYCADPRGYYPFVQSCDENWESVPSTPPPPRQR